MVGQKTNALFYSLTYREIQSEVAELAKKLGVPAVELSKDLGKRAARESAARHADVLSIVPINPNSPDKIVKYVEILWFVLFGKELRDYEIRVDDETPGRQRLTFLIKKCPVCMGYKEDVGRYQEMYKMFTGKESEGYACMMAGMLEELARIIMENKGYDIRIVVSETQCYARGDPIMAVQAQIVPLSEYTAMKQLVTGLSTPVQPVASGEAEAGGTGNLGGIGKQSVRLFAKIYEQLQLEKLDTFFESPSDQVKIQLSDAVEKQLHFKPKDILAYFQNYEEDIFRVVGYLLIHGLNEASGIIEQSVQSYFMSKVIDILLSAIEYGLDTYIPDKIIQDNKQLVLELMTGWAPESSVEKIKTLESKQMFKLVLEGVKMAFADYGAEFVGAKEATWTLLKKSSLLKDEGETPSQTFSTLFDIFQEASLVAGYLMAIPIKMLISTEYESAKSPITSAQDVYHASRQHLEKLFDLIEKYQETDRSADQERRVGEDIRKAFPRVF